MRVAQVAEKCQAVYGVLAIRGAVKAYLVHEGTRKTLCWAWSTVFRCWPAREEVGYLGFPTQYIYRTVLYDARGGKGFVAAFRSVHELSRRRLAIHS